MGKSRKSRASATTSSKQTAKDQETKRFEEAQKILDTPNVVTCVKKAEDLVVCNEARVDFDNLADHGFDIRDQVDLQGWTSYFNRLCGPIYHKLVVEFRKNAVCNDYYVVSHVLDRKIVISEESIAKLLGMEFQQGKRIKNVDANVPGMRKHVNFAIYNNWTMDRTKYAIKDLKPQMKIWQKIFISCIHPRTGGTDYLNATQKVIMYYISRGEPVCLPFLLFNYLKECVEKSRTTGGENKRSISYIPYGRLLSDIFTQNRLVKALFDLGLHDDLAMTIGDPLRLNRRKTHLRRYVRRTILSEGDPITLEEFVTTLPDSPPEMPTRRGKKTTSKPSDPKGKGILIEEPKKKEAASKSVVIRELTPEKPPKKTSVQSPQLSESESSENSLEESSSEETEDDDVPLAKRRKVIFEEEDEQDDCEIIQDVLQVIRESSEAEESTDSDAVPLVKRRKLPLKGPLQEKEAESKQTLLITQTGEISAEEEKEDDDVQILEPPFNVKPLQQVASNFEDQLQDAPETSYVSLSNYSAVNSRDLKDAEMIPAEVVEDSSDDIVILEDADANVVEKQGPIQVDAAMSSEAAVAAHTQAPEVTTSAPAPEVTTLAARIDRIQDDQQRLFQMVEQQGLVQIEQSRQIQESSRRMEDMMKFLIEHLPSSSKP
ncbi:uncharacterized protein LOC130744297 [Lotus japonicus]|uniref:uncharacterized protein LOC130744297 n=1 Tax=Lotus japonicus TaxID=34305 RepID=UPI00258D1301|nr:uncharacterized protein LOC130744297 [Lotus japonicus]